MRESVIANPGCEYAGQFTGNLSQNRMFSLWHVLPSPSTDKAVSKDRKAKKRKQKIFLNQTPVRALYRVNELRGP